MMTKYTVFSKQSTVEMKKMTKAYENAYAKSIRITRETHEQLRLIASYQRRSMRVCLELMIEQKLESLNEGKEAK